ncbi:MAG: DNA photolyase family protein [Oligoflexia bacterium]|nr:DNA photolyase family protein [Oligoflexia bacterium]
MKNIQRGIVIFRRDLRVHDNTALHAALTQCDQVSPVFIFDPRQISDHPYRSVNGLAFLVESLEELSAELKALGSELLVMEGSSEIVAAQLALSWDCKDVFVNKDYTPFARERDRNLSAELQKVGATLHSYSDALLLEPSKFSKQDGRPYTVFTPFYKRASEEAVARCLTLPKTFKLANAPKGIKRKLAKSYLPKQAAPHRLQLGGRSQGLKLLERAAGLNNYNQERDFPALSATSLLSAHHKFGTLSIREVYWSLVATLGRDSTLVRELYWRDFFTHIAWHFPHVFQSSFNPAFSAVEWSDNQDHFSAWCEGRTGFPIVDAGIRELLATGFMHNRVRMIVASFLVKDLHIDWRKGEAFFARHLTDYDPSVNNGNWQWAASTGCDAQPYFRVFNPWLQQGKFDPQCTYIKRWIPELASASAKQIHSLAEPDATRFGEYPLPIVEHSHERDIAIEAFERAKKSGR